jgi:DNA-directed RNA polymerase specialized sigma24 family protein
MAMDAKRAGRVVEETFARAWAGFDELPDDDQRAHLWLLKIALHVTGERLPRSPEVNFDILDETLRNEATRTDVVRSLSDPQRDLLLVGSQAGLHDQRDQLPRPRRARRVHRRADLEAVRRR